MFLHTLDDTSWSIADIIGPIGTGTHNFLINFTANETEYASIHFVGDANSGHVYYDDTLVASYPRTVWEDAAYQQIAIAGGIDATNPTLLAWFKQYAKNGTPSGGDVDIVSALKAIAAAISGGGGGGGGMPANYPYEFKTLFEGNVEYEDERAEIEGLKVPAGTPITITINGTKTDLFYDANEMLWGDTNPPSPEDFTIVFGNGHEGDPAWLWMKDAPGGTYAVKIEGNGLNENFEDAVKEIAGGSSSGGVLMIHCDGAATIKSGRVIIPTDCTEQDVLSCIDLKKGIFLKPIFIHLPVLANSQTGEYSYSDNRSAVYLVQSLAKFNSESIVTIDGFSYGITGAPEGIFVVVAETMH